MAALAQASEELFRRRLIGLVSSRPWHQPDPEIDAKCMDWIARARAAGFTTEFEVAAFVLCGFHFGANFCSRPDLPFDRILRDPGAKRRIQASQMLVVLEESERAWREAVKARAAGEQTELPR